MCFVSENKIFNFIINSIVIFIIYILFERLISIHCNTPFKGGSDCISNIIAYFDIFSIHIKNSIGNFIVKEYNYLFMYHEHR